MGDLVLGFALCFGSVFCTDINTATVDLSNYEVATSEPWMNSNNIQQFLHENGDFDQLPNGLKKKVINHVQNNADLYTAVAAIYNKYGCDGGGENEGDAIILHDDVQDNH